MGRNGQGLPPARLLRGTWGGEALGSVPGGEGTGTVLCGSWDVLLEGVRGGGG